MNNMQACAHKLTCAAIMVRVHYVLPSRTTVLLRELSKDWSKVDDPDLHVLAIAPGCLQHGV